MFFCSWNQSEIHQVRQRERAFCRHPLGSLASAVCFAHRIQAWNTKCKCLNVSNEFYHNNKISLFCCDSEMAIIQQCSVIFASGLSHALCIQIIAFFLFSGLQCIFHQASEILSTLMIWYSLPREISAHIFLSHHKIFHWKQTFGDVFIWRVCLLERCLIG